MLVEGLSRRQIQGLAIEVLKRAGTLAEDRVYEPRDWPTEPKLFPLVLAQTPYERKAGLYPGQLQFNTTIALKVTGRVRGVEPEAVNDALDLLSGQIEQALMLSQDFALGIQQFVSIETQSVVNADGRWHVGELSMVFELEVYQAFMASGDPLTNVTGTLAPDGGAAGVQPIIIQSSAG